jgi:RimJ/RimL family protein N-acetyltransferase
MRTLHTPRLRMVPVTPANAGQLWELLQQPDLRTYQDLPNLALRAFEEMVAARPAQLKPRSAGRFEWMVQIGRPAQNAGWVSLRVAQHESHAGEIGYSVLREYRGRGVATEAVRALLAEAFEIAGLGRVRAFCVPENAASRRLLVRLNFEPDGVLAHGATVSGKPVDVLVHKLERARWLQSGKTMEMSASAYPA